MFRKILRNKSICHTLNIQFRRIRVRSHDPERVLTDHNVVRSNDPARNLTDQNVVRSHDPARVLTYQNVVRSHDPERVSTDQNVKKPEMFRTILRNKSICHTLNIHFRRIRVRSHGHFR